MKIISRSEVIKADKEYNDMLKTENHHQHEIIEYDHGTCRWKENENVNKIL